MRVLKRSAGFTALVLILALSLSFGAGAASLDPFPDGTGHWAEPYLRRAVSEGLLAGDSTGRLAPDSPATLAQTLTVLARMLWPTARVSAEDMGLPAGRWYSGSAAAARAMGLSFDAAELDSSYFPRARAFTLLAEAFRLIPAEPDYAVLAAFSDSGDLLDGERAAAAAMVSAGIVNGSGGRLDPRSPLTRAELVTMLLRIAEHTFTAAPQSLTGGAVLKSAADLAGKRHGGRLWLTCDAGDVDLGGVTAETVVVLSRNAAVRVDSRTSIDRLVIAGGGGETLDLDPGRVGALVIADGAPKTVTVSGNVDTVELTADGLNVTVRSRTSRLVVSGRGNTVSVPSGTTKGIALTSLAEDNTVYSRVNLARIDVDGRQNKLVLSGGCAAAVVGGVSCTVSGGVYISSLNVTSRSANVLVAGNRTNSFPTGAGGVSFALSAPSTVDAAGPLTLTATAEGYEFADCTLTWYLDGRAVSTQNVTVGYGANTFTCDVPLDLADGMSAWRHVSAVLTYRDGSTARRTAVVLLTGTDSLLDGAEIRITPEDHALSSHIKATATVTNPLAVTCTAVWTVEGRTVSSETVRIGPAPVTLTVDRDLDFMAASEKGTVALRLTVSGSAASASATATLSTMTPQKALDTVTAVYAGDYTLEWALANDYDPVTKTVWVNAKGYASDTRYLIWVNKTYQRVNIFEGSQGSWTLTHTFLCGTGNNNRGTATPTSVSKVRHRLEGGWTHSTYNVRPVVYFLTGGYAFHSRLYDPTHSYLTDPSIGFPVSLGCIRMYDEDVRWIYDNIPTDTTVVVH